MIKDVLNAVETALKPNTNIRYINEDWGQLDYYPTPPVLWPCVLLECEAVDFTTQGRNQQLGNGVLTIRVADLKMFNQQNAKASATTERYAFFYLLDEIHAVVQGLKGVTFSPLDRRKLLRARRDDNIREFVLNYAFTYKDMAATKPQHIMSVPGVITKIATPAD